MKVVICPGAHDGSLTADFLAEMGAHLSDPIVYPTDRYPVYSPQHLLDFLDSTLSIDGSASPLFFIGFSAGAVSAIGAARQWQRRRRQVAALVAIDGWGVPLYGDFPIYRISHDWFTHWSSAVLGTGKDSFYADPAVAHLDLWRSPQTAQGWWVQAPGGDRAATPTATQPATRTATRTATTAARFLLTCLRYHGE